MGMVRLELVLAEGATEIEFELANNGLETGLTVTFSAAEFVIAPSSTIIFRVAVPTAAPAGTKVMAREAPAGFV